MSRAWACTAPARIVAARSERAWLDGKFTAILVTHDVAEAVTLADRIVLIENGGVGLDLDITLPRPRRRGSIEFAAIEERVLERLLENPISRHPSFAAM